MTNADEPRSTSLKDRLPLLSDGELTNLSNNATRLKETGTAIQRRSADDLLPLIQSELERRRAEKANAPAKPRAKKADGAAPAKKPRKAKKEDADDEADE